MSVNPGDLKLCVPAIALLIGGCSSVTAEAPSPSDQAAWAAQCADDDDWDKPGPPFQIIGDTYYVGTCGISAILITGDEGHIVIDSGTKAGAEVVAANIQKLGFALSDVKILLMSHEHYDHVGGLARLQQLTGAKALVSPAARQAMEGGPSSPNDPQHGLSEPLAAVRMDGLVVSGEPVRLGRLAVRPLATPGHTPGALSWQWNAQSSDGSATEITFADSLTPISNDTYRFTDHPAYLAAFRESLGKLAETKCRVLLTPHPSFSGMRDNIIDNGRISPSDTACTDLAEMLTKRLDDRIAKETAQ